MRVMVFGTAAAGGGEGAAPTAKAFAAMDVTMDELARAGILVAAAGLRNDAEARRIAPDGAVAAGPFAEGRDLVLGFSIWQVSDMDEAVAWAQRNPLAAAGEIEIRPFYEPEDLAEYLTPEELAKPRTGERGRLGVA